MSISIEERLARAASVLDEHVERRPVTGLYDAAEPPAHRHRAPLAMAAALVAIALVIGVLNVGGNSELNMVSAPPGPGHEAGTEGWDLLAPAPIAARFQHLAVSTGSGLLVWGGYTGDGPRTDGAFYDGRSGEWRTLPKAPLSGSRGDAIGAWTGVEVVVVNGIDGHVKAAAFDPTSFTWRSLPDPPLTNAANMMARLLPTDAGVVVIAVSTEGEGGARNEVALYDAAADRWTIGEPPPMSFGSAFDAVNVGDQVVLVGRRGGGGASCGDSVTLSYAPRTNRWRQLPDGPIGDRGGLVIASIGSEVLAAGGFVCGDPRPRREAFLLDPATSSWRNAATAPTTLSGGDRYGDPANGPLVFALDEAGVPALYDAAADRWQVGPAHPLGGRYTETPWSWVNDKIVAFSGGLANDEGGCCQRVDGGYAYTPASIQSAVGLDAGYEACVVAGGFDPGGVQVVVAETGVPEWVKTGRDVPAAIHGPCLVQIGGTDPQASSHGIPSG